jgi:hypothetical protein
VLVISLIGWNVTFMVHGFTVQRIQTVSVWELARDQAGYVGRTVILKGILVPRSLALQAVRL